MRFFVPVNPQLITNLIRNHKRKNEMGKGVFRRNALSSFSKNSCIALQSFPNTTISCSFHYCNDYIRINIFLFRTKNECLREYGLNKRI